MWLGGTQLSGILIGLVVIGLLLCGGSAWAQVGNRSFSGSMVTESPDPGNSLSLGPAWYNTQAVNAFSLGFGIEKQFTDNTSLQVNDAWNAENCTDFGACAPESFNRHHHQINRRQGEIGNVGNGFDNMQILGKLVVDTSVAHEFRMGIGPNLFLSSGDIKAGADTHTYAGPIAMLEKGMGDIPDSGLVRWLRPVAFQADGGVLVQTGGTQANEWYSDLVVAYDFSYLGSYVKDVTVPPWLAHFVPFAEFTMAGLFYQSASAGGASPDFRVGPGVACMLGDYSLTVGTQIALNQGSLIYDHSSVLTGISLPLSIFGRGLDSPLLR